MNGLTGISALIIGKGHWQIKTEIRRDAGDNLTLDLRPAGVVGFDSIIPIGASQLNSVHRFINGIAKRQGYLGIWYGWRCLCDCVDLDLKALTQAVG